MTRQDIIDFLDRLRKPESADPMHPFPGVPDSPVFCGVGKKNTGRRLSSRTINAMYENYKNVYFPKLLDDPSISEEDKRKIRDLLKKKWNPYVRRHTAATELSKALKDPVIIDQYMGWSHRGNTRHKYQHYYADDSFDAILQADGLLLTPMGGSSPNKKKKDLLKPKQCPNCDEPNTPETKFCIKCRYVLSYNAYNETIEEKEKAAKEAEEKEKELKVMRASMSNLEKIMPLIMEKIENMNKQLAEEKRKNEELPSTAVRTK